MRAMRMAGRLLLRVATVHKCCQIVYDGMQYNLQTVHTWSVWFSFDAPVEHHHDRWCCIVVTYGDRPCFARTSLLNT